MNEPEQMKELMETCVLVAAPIVAIFFAFLGGWEEETRKGAMLNGFMLGTIGLAIGAVLGVVASLIISLVQYAIGWVGSVPEQAFRALGMPVLFVLAMMVLGLIGKALSRRDK